MGNYFWPIGNLFDSHLRIHYSAAAVPITFVAIGAIAGFTPFQYLHILTLTLTTALCLFMHELGHVGIANLLGVGTHSVTLYPIGAISRLKREPPTPGSDIMIALCGPIVSLLLAGFCFSVSALRGYVTPSSLATLAQSDIFGQVGAINLVVAAVNLTPVLPLDGGRIVRSFLALFSDFETATRWSMHLSVCVAILCFIFGFTCDPGLFLVAAFIWFGATRDAYSIEARSLLRSKVATDYLSTSVKTLRADMPLTAVLDYTISERQRDFPVTENGRVIGFVSAAEIRRGLQGARQNVLLRSLLEKKFFHIDHDTTIGDALDYMNRHRLTLVPVLNGSEYLGVLTKAEAQQAMFEQSVQAEVVHNSSRNILS